MAYSDSTRAGLKVAASPIGCGKLVASLAAWPWRHSSWKMTGMPSRLFSRKKRWIALVSSAFRRGLRPGGPPASLGRPTWPRPWPSAKAAAALAGSNAPAASTSISALPFQTQTICAAFSSSVMRARRSRARSAAGAPRSR
jgi:hypothetical protein